jgi:hypothetical protein
VQHSQKNAAVAENINTALNDVFIKLCRVVPGVSAAAGSAAIQQGHKSRNKSLVYAGSTHTAAAGPPLFNSSAAGPNHGVCDTRTGARSCQVLQSSQAPERFLIELSGDSNSDASNLFIHAFKSSNVPARTTSAVMRRQNNRMFTCGALIQSTQRLQRLSFSGHNVAPDPHNESFADARARALIVCCLSAADAIRPVDADASIGQSSVQTPQQQGFHAHKTSQGLGRNV